MVRYLQHCDVAVPDYDTKFRQVMAHFSDTRELHMYFKFTQSGALSSTLNTQSLQLGHGAGNGEYMLSMSNYYKYVQHAIVAASARLWTALAREERCRGRPPAATQPGDQQAIAAVSARLLGGTGAGGASRGGTLRAPSSRGTSVPALRSLPGSGRALAHEERGSGRPPCAAQPGTLLTSGPGPVHSDVPSWHELSIAPSPSQLAPEEESTPVWGGRLLLLGV